MIAWTLIWIVEQLNWNDSRIWWDHKMIVLIVSQTLRQITNRKLHWNRHLYRPTHTHFKLKYLFTCKDMAMDLFIYTYFILQWQHNESSRHDRGASVGKLVEFKERTVLSEIMEILCKRIDEIRGGDHAHFYTHLKSTIFFYCSRRNKVLPVYNFC